MENIIEHKGYFGTIEPSVEDGVLYGKIMGINDLVTYEADNIKDLEKEFRLSVEEYLDFCKELGKEPDKFYHGVFNVRTSSDKHMRLSLMAQKKNIKLNDLVNRAFDFLVNNEDQVLHGQG